MVSRYACVTLIDAHWRHTHTSEARMYAGRAAREKVGVE